MPKCFKCGKFYHPDYCIDIAPYENNSLKICVFCKTNKKEVTIEDENGREILKVTKRDAERNYAAYIKKLTEKREIAHLIRTGDKSRIITDI